MRGASSILSRQRGYVQDRRHGGDREHRDEESTKLLLLLLCNVGMARHRLFLVLRR